MLALSPTCLYFPRIFFFVCVHVWWLDELRTKVILASPCFLSIELFSVGAGNKELFLLKRDEQLGLVSLLRFRTISTVVVLLSKEQ
uniref:Uncharacterized protein n=1 Tax=Ixodes scapularis TaxID=6945 RepID=A0A4D5RZL0_IXOSC